MNSNPEVVAKEILRVSSMLVPDGFVLITVKLRMNSPESEAKKKLQILTQLLSSQFKDFHLRWLCVNSLSERTLIARKSNQ